MKKIVVYSGRFQPFHVGHYNTYKSIIKNFPDADVWIATSNKTDKVKSPFNFKEKHKIMTKMFPDLAGKIQEIRNPYAPKEIFEKYDPENHSYIAVVSEKDASRLRGKYFEPYKGQELENFLEKGYVWVTTKKSKDEMFRGEVISGTLVRSLFGDDNIEQDEKIDFFKAMYGKFDKNIFNLLDSKIVNESDNFTSIKDFLLIEDAKNFFEEIQENLLLEGGAFGHLAHPYEDINMTFGQMKDLTKDVLNNKVDYNVEKTDGQNLLISYKNGEVVAARNKGHLKNSGEKSLNVDGVKNMFAGRGEIQEAFVTAMEDLESAMLSLPTNKLVEFFEEGKNFMTLEVMYPKNANVIPYGHALLVFQGIISHDIDGNALEYSREQAAALARMIEEVNASVQQEYKIMMQPSLELPKNTSELEGKYMKEMDSIKKKYNMSDSDQLKDYMTMEWKAFIKKLPYDISPELENLLINRWVYNSKQPNIREIKKLGDANFGKWISKFEKKEIKQVQKNVRKPFELYFLKLGSDLLKEIKSVLTLDQKAATDQMIKSLDKTIRDIRKTNDPDKIEKLERELARLQAVGGFDSIVPIEGIVFQKNDTLYKLTGTFAPLNALMGILTY